MQPFARLLLLISAISVTPAFAQNAENLPALANNIATVMEQNHYNPRELNQVAYQKTLDKVRALVDNATNTADFIEQYNQLWQQGPFSHVRLMQSAQTAAQMADYLDNMNVGGKGALLEIKDNIAILTVNTMMGLDTITQINTAYQQISEQQIKALIIDLRHNQGGAFAVKPLVGHLLSTEKNTGVFLSQSWNAAHHGFPSLEQSSQYPSWQGWSIKSFWHDVQQQPLTPIAFTPMAPQFGGAVYVLISHKTASAAEMSSDALATLDNVTLIGEQTAGQMLSQKMYDVAPGLILALPIADYYAWHSGRIEGQGVKPDINVPAQQAMQIALD